MGLEITAYSRVRFVAPHVDDDWEEHEEQHIYVHVLASFVDRLDGLAPGWYAVDGRQESFRAGSYGGYNEWRRQLSMAALGVPPETLCEWSQWAGKPFAELIHFADNEGCIGPRTSAKLRDDFDRHPELADPVSPGDPFSSLFEKWRDAFALAADDGLVRFH